ncbi:histidine phosphatase family protein [uncultured Lutibacter sp.]|uniref:histidine phosphatase family protein n=1 Tax=uncultured Lutibacter sp. TaxID=437739 RepID=UPI00260E0876|nr:histidine phosphatase family protein [uncultured Lutibacter sp.]
MKNIAFFLFIALYSLNIQSQNSDITTYYFIRHAEKVTKDKTNNNPELSKKGNKRAKEWSEIFENIKFDAIYSTNYFRTLQTAQPTARKNNLEIQFYNPRELVSPDFQVKTKGKTILVVGHSNTTPAIVNKILNNNKYSTIKENVYGNLYIVTLTKTDKIDILLKI